MKLHDEIAIEGTFITWAQLIFWLGYGYAHIEQAFREVQAAERQEQTA